MFIDDVWSGGTAADGDYPLLSEAIAQGLYHPRCKDSHTTFFPGITDDESLTKPYTKEEMEQFSIADYQQEKAQYAQRQAEKFRRMEKFSLDENNKVHYSERAEVWEEAAVESHYQDVYDAVNQMEHPYGPALGYQFNQVRKVITDNPDITFAYAPNKDVIFFNPSNPKFYDYDFVPSVLHEVGHRYDFTVARSWEQPAFIQALTDGKAYVRMNLDEMMELVEETADNGFIQDILDILGNGSLQTYAGHDGELTEKEKASEIFANLTSLKVTKNKGYLELKRHSPDLLHSFETIFEGE